MKDFLILIGLLLAALLLIVAFFARGYVIYHFLVKYW